MRPVEHVLPVQGERGEGHDESYGTGMAGDSFEGKIPQGVQGHGAEGVGREEARAIAP